MQFYSEDVIEEVIMANDIVDVVSSYVKLEKKGKYMFGLCPFHKEKSPSFSVTPSKQIYYCYSCQKGGNVLHFVMGVENLNFTESLKMLAARSRVSLPENLDNADNERIKLKKDIISANIEAARYYHKCLMEDDGEEARKYLEQRKVGQNIITKFGIGYSPKKGDILLKHLQNMNFDQDVIKKCGLFVENSKGKLYDRFRSRIMFPIFDLRGSVIAFGGRVLDDSMPKYINSSESLVYTKGRNLYALNFVRKTSDKKIIIVEGYMDVVSLHQFGITNTVASLGTALTEEQGRLLRMYAEEIVIAYDTDLAGQNATNRGIEVLNELGCNVKVLKVPKGKDPDEYIKENGRDSFLKLINNSLSLLEYKVGLVKNTTDISSTAGKVDFLNKTALILSKSDNSIEREMYIKKISKDYQIREDSLEAEIEKNMKVASQKKGLKEVLKSSVANSSSNASKEKSTKDHDYEKILIVLLCIDNSILKEVKNDLNVNYFRNDSEKQLLQYVIDKIELKKGINLPGLVSTMEVPQAEEYIRILNKECVFEDNLKAFRDIQKKIETENSTNRQQEILSLLKKNDNLDELYVIELKKELSFILSQKKNI